MNRRYGIWTRMATMNKVLLLILIVILIDPHRAGSISRRLPGSWRASTSNFAMSAEILLGVFSAFIASQRLEWAFFLVAAPLPWVFTVHSLSPFRSRGGR